MTVRLTYVLTKYTDDEIIATCKEFPGAMVKGKTFKEALEGLDKSIVIVNRNH